MESSETSADAAQLIHIHPDDNVGVLARSVRIGDVIAVAGVEVAATADFVLGHKFALRDISAGEKVLKYGVPIGSAKCAIGQGDHVHLHNLQSDYLPTYTLEGERSFEG